MGLPEFESGSSAPKAERIPSYPTAPFSLSFEVFENLRFSDIRELLFSNTPRCFASQSIRVLLILEVHSYL